MAYFHNTDHSYCAQKLRNGTIEFINEAESFSIDVCGGYGICDHGKLEIYYCPGKIFIFDFFRLQFTVVSMTCKLICILTLIDN